MDVVRMLLEQKLTSTRLRMKDGATPLYIASEKGYVEVVRMLLEAGS